MIYGVIPIGGKGLRLGLPFSKEMLPQKNLDHYRPIASNTVDKMLSAGADQIYFIHGNEYKYDVISFFQGPQFHHILQNKLGPATVLIDFYQSVLPKNHDQILFGLPDTVYETNPFPNLLPIAGIACGLFDTIDTAKVDRVSLIDDKFLIKVAKDDNNTHCTWAVIKFDGLDLSRMIVDQRVATCIDTGEILNLYPNTRIHCGSYLDIGTWDNYNAYIKD